MAAPPGPKAPSRNRLAHETSPYLLMHADNPVDWYPWGEEALARAKRENKVIFLSVGYSSCHWCHVMEHESFMDQEIARFLNEHFVCIKLDREERPDVDSIYMTAVQIITGSGGWPLSVFLTPDAKPLFGGTYFPARDGDRNGQVGFLTVARQVYQVWSQQRDQARRSANELADLVAEQLRGPRGVEPISLDNALLQQVMTALGERYDQRYGGFGFDPANSQRPKFPEPSNLLFLIDRAGRHSDPKARAMLEGTLTNMAQGGIRDQLGGGFHRYSVDRYWHIPHFEKMLYDNGQLASVYAEAYRLTRRPDFRRVLVQLADFVLRELTAPEAAFFSALDADSEGAEGKYYCWERTELHQILSGSQFNQIGPLYGFDRPPNFQSRFYVPLLTTSLTAMAKRQGIAEDELDRRLAPLRQKLLAAREQRIRPATDSKILTSWNGLMIRGLADAGRELDDARYTAAADRAARFVLRHLRAKDGRLLRTYAGGRAKLNAYLDDYAFLVDGLIALHQSTGDQRWLKAADQLTQQQIEGFWDGQNGGFFFTAADHQRLIARGKIARDGPRPAGNSVAALNLLYLARALPRPEYADRAEKTIVSASALLRRSPASAPRLAVAVSRLLEYRGSGKP